MASDEILQQTKDELKKQMRQMTELFDTWDNLSTDQQYQVQIHAPELTSVIYRIRYGTKASD